MTLLQEFYESSLNLLPIAIVFGAVTAVVIIIIALLKTNEED